MKKNTHLPSDQYLSDASLGMMLSKEMNERAAEALDETDAKVTFFKEGDDDFGYEIKCGDAHEQIDTGYETLLDAVGGFIDWYNRYLGDEDDDED